MGVQPKTIFLFIAPFVLAVAAAYAELAIVGLPKLPPIAPPPQIAGTPVSE